ncbi:MAG: ABC transporter ATP-binding protein [Albidovulum sp.]|nr:ABC transporter ATP-binding protein [Albidovulum sp.]MDE0306001.1 ABC transporter ATP-binding protein [Albidovulum sp.]
MANVTLTDLNKIFGSGPDAVHAVQDLNLKVDDGEFIALLGPSGCGKTSTLRMIVGLETVTSGKIHFDDRNVTTLEPQQRNVAMAFETYALYPNFTVGQNLSFPLEVQGVDEATRKKRAFEVAQLLRIADLLDEYPPSLSGGQQQRVSLGRALIREPSVFILDEVMSHLDAHLKFQMLLDLKRLHQELSRTMIYVTHDQVEALALADRVAVMSNAKLQQVGTRNDLYASPSNIFVADFIGEPPTNFFETAVAGTGSETCLSVQGADMLLELSDKAKAKVKNHRLTNFIAGIRPQNLTIERAGAKLSATVKINEYLGERSILTVEKGGVQFRALVPPSTRIGHGESIDLFYNSANVMVFDSETKALIS